MAKNGKKTRREQGEWRHLVGSAALLVAVFGTLLLGAVLQVESDTVPETAPPLLRELEVEVEPPLDGEETARDVADPGMAVPFDGDSDLVDRAAEDERRLLASGSGYTLQFAVNCETKNVRANLGTLQTYQDFYLLTMLLDDRACFRLCWGFYNNERQARSDRKVPEILLGMTDKPKVLSISEALP